MSFRPVSSQSRATPTVEGAGVHLHRAFGFQNPDAFDPFLLLDDFRNDDPKNYASGFPWHPHRGIETITYVLKGSVEHQDSLGNIGQLGAGDVQWMSSGSGILHQEMPHGDEQGKMHGFQLWANIPSHLKMGSPQYRDVASEELPEIIDDDGTQVRVIMGGFWGKTSPLSGMATDPLYLDISIPASTKKRFKIDTHRRSFAYVFSGNAHFFEASAPVGVLIEKTFEGHEMTLRDRTGNRSLVQFARGSEILVETQDSPVRFLLVAGAPIEEPVAWHGPIVMNTREELRTAFRELNEGRFIKQPAKVAR